MTPGLGRVVLWLARTLRDAAWAPLAVFVAHVVASRGLDAYSKWPDLDVPMHLLGGVAIAYFFHTLSIHGSALGLMAPANRLTHCLLVFGLTCAAAVFWEFAEFLSDHYFGTRMQCGNLNDTLRDMLMGVVGGLSFLAVAWAWGGLSPHGGDRGAKAL